jgi:hypothetical protein
LEQMDRSYNNTLRHLKLDDSVERYKKFLVYGFMAAEWLMVKLLKMETGEGFARYQITNINEYDKLLFELGEKSYCPGSKEWPVEVRLAMMILFNMAAFIVGKMVSGGTVLGLVQSVFNTNTSAPIEKKKKRSMKGPKINLDKILSSDDEDD